MIRRIEDKAEDRDGFRFRGGNVALDLTATLQRRLTATPSELLKKPNDLARWLVSSGLTETAPPVTDTHLESAKVLREAIFTLASAANCGALDPDAVSILNNIAEPPPS